MTQINRKEAIRYIVLTPNQRGYDGAIAADADEIAIFAVRNRNLQPENINCSIEESLARFEPVRHRHVRVTCLSEVIFPVWWAVLMRVMLPLRQSNMLQTDAGARML